MTCYLSPLLQDPQFSDDGTFLSSGLIWFYEAGTSTPVAAYQDQAGTVAWSNPIQLNARGETGGEIWLTGGQAYKMILETAPSYGQSHGVVISTFDNISGINDVNAQLAVSNWTQFTAATVNPDTSISFYVEGDYLTTFQDNRRIRATATAGTVYGRISAANYNGASDITTVFVVCDSGNLTGISAVAYGIIETDPSSIPIAVGTGDSTGPAAENLYIGWDGSAATFSVDNTDYTDWPITTTQTDFSALTVNGDAVLTADDITATLAAAGALLLPTASGNLLVKWGFDTINTTNTAINYPAAFPTSTLAVFIQSYDSNVHYSSVVSTTASGFVAKGSAANSYYWLAIGH
jgi:hypothetical protein